jgi:putative nucleotidyltransferase with HDIG domain
MNGAPVARENAELSEASRSPIIPARYYSLHTHTMLMMSAALGLKDKYTQAHGQRVAVYSGRLAEFLNLPSKEIQLITMGGLLHDIGKLALSDRIFSNCKTSLSQDMLCEVRNHPILGAKLLQRINCAPQVCNVVLYHHERVDGSGYPHGLSGEEIPLGARIVGIVDCFDAITTDRPYQKRKGCEEAFNLLSEMAGVSLQAELVRAFIREIRQHGMIPSNQTAAPIHLPVAATAH